MRRRPMDVAIALAMLATLPPPETSYIPRPPPPPDPDDDEYTRSLRSVNRSGITEETASDGDAHERERPQNIRAARRPPMRNPNPRRDGIRARARGRKKARGW